MLVFGRSDGVFQHRRNLFPGEQNATLQREISYLLAIIGIELGHDVRAIVLESADFRQIRGVNKNQAGCGPKQDHSHKNNRECQASRERAPSDLQSNRRQWEHCI